MKQKIELKKENNSTVTVGDYESSLAIMGKNTKKEIKKIKVNAIRQLEPKNPKDYFYSSKIPISLRYGRESY